MTVGVARRRTMASDLNLPIGTWFEYFALDIVFWEPGHWDIRIKKKLDGVQLDNGVYCIIFLRKI